jgi:hypothetical protein
MLVVLLGGITLLGFADSMELYWGWLLGALLGGMTIGLILRIKHTQISQIPFWNHIFVYGIMSTVIISRYLTESWQVVFQCSGIVLYFCFLSIQFPNLMAPFAAESKLIQFWWIGLISLTVVLNGAFKMILTETGLTLLIYSQIVVTLILYFQILRKYSATSDVIGSSPATSQNNPSIFKKLVTFSFKGLALVSFLPLLAPILYVTEDSRISFDVRVLLPIPLALLLLIVIDAGMLILVGFGLRIMQHKPKFEFGLRHFFSMLIGASLMVCAVILADLSLDLDFWLMIAGLFAHSILGIAIIFIMGPFCVRMSEKMH